MKTEGYSLATVLRKGSTLVPLVERGLGAVKAADRTLFAPAIKLLIGDGIDLDSATAAAYPNDHRWDYVLAVPQRKALIGVEPHTAGDGEVSVVIKKKNNAVSLLREHLAAGVGVHAWYWITHGRVGFSRMERAVRALNQNGISFRGRSLTKLD